MSLSDADLATLLASPALEAPAGVTPDFDNPPNRNGLAIFVTTFCMIIATLCLCLRLYAKLWITRAVQVQEVFIVLAYAAYCTTAYAAYAMVSAPGYYVHQYNMTSGQLITPLYLILIYGCAYSATLPLLKTSILLDWCQIFVPAGRSKNFFWWGCAAIIFIQVTSGIVVTTLLNMQCVPHAAIWKFYLPSKCYVVSDVMLGSASVQVLSDWSMVLLPHKVIWSLHMDWQKKVGISIIFMAGILASVSASVRLSTTITFAKETDQMYYIGPLLFWACAEMTCGFFILCVPCFPSIIKHFGLQSKVKEFFGISTKASDPSTSSSATYGQSGNSKGKWGRRKVRAELESADPYYKMDETKTLSLEKLTPTRSQDPEHGWEGEGEGGGVHVTRTTDVSSITDPESAQTSNTLKNQQILPWAQ